MTKRYAIYFTATEAAAYRADRGRLVEEARFPADESGAAAFREYLRPRGRALVHVVADLAGEDFHEESIPFLHGADRRAILERRIAQRYRDSRLAASVSIGRTSGERRNERVLLASFTNTQQFTPWLNAIAESDARLAGVYSVPLLAPALAAAAGTRKGKVIVVSITRAGLRQTFVDEGKLRFARLEAVSESAPGVLAAFVRSETQRLAQYLITMRALARDGAPVDVLVVTPDGHRTEFERALQPDSRLAFRVIDQVTADRAAGLRRTPGVSLGESPYLYLATRKPPTAQFAQLEDTREFFLWKLSRWVVATGAAGLAACALWAGLQWLEVLSVRDQTLLRQDEAGRAAAEYARITAGFPVTLTTTENLRATVVEFTRIAQANRGPEPMLVHLASVLNAFPQVEVESLSWQVPKGPGSAAPAPGAARPAPPPVPAPGAAAATAEAREALEIDARINVARSADFREITVEVERFAAGLVAGSPYQVIRMQLPFDVTSEGTLSGEGIQTSGGTPRFTLVIGRGGQ